MVHRSVPRSMEQHNGAYASAARQVACMIGPQGRELIAPLLRVIE